MLYHVWWFNPLLWVVLSTHPVIIVAIPIAWQTNQPTPENCLWKPIDISMVSWFVCYPLLPTVSNNHHRWRYLRRYYMFVILSPVYLHSKKKLIGGLEPWNFMTFHILGISSSRQAYFFRGVGIPPTRIGVFKYPSHWLIFFKIVKTTNQLYHYLHT